MKRIIVFASSHGTTEKASRLLSEYLSGDVELVNLKKNPSPNIESYDSVIIGGSIHAGSLQAKVKKFIKQNQNVLLNKEIGLFICCMHEGDEAKSQFEKAFTQELREISISNSLFGGEFIFTKMNFIEKQIVKKVSGINNDTSKIDVNAIKEFADRFNANI